MAYVILLIGALVLCNTNNLGTPVLIALHLGVCAVYPLVFCHNGHLIYHRS